MQKIDISLKISPTFVTIIFVLWLGAIILALSLQESYGFKVILVLITIVYGGWIFFEHALLRGPTSIFGLRYLVDQHWQLIGNHEDGLFELLGDSTVTAWVSILRFRRIDNKKVQSIVIFRDSCLHSDYRRLLVLLRCFRPA